MVRFGVYFEDTPLEFIYELGMECERKRNQGRPQGHWSEQLEAELPFAEMEKASGFGKDQDWCFMHKV